MGIFSIILFIFAAFLPLSAEDIQQPIQVQAKLKSCPVKESPNPFNPETTISFSICSEPGFVITTPGRQNEHIELCIYNIKGQIIKKFPPDVILSGVEGSSGGHIANSLPCDSAQGDRICRNGINSKTYKVTWNGTDDYGRRVGSGIYFCRLKTKKNSDMIKIIILK